MAAPQQKVRVRYAPSPTGIPHVGNIRTALFNWLFARHHGGVFIVRVEDTDQARLVEGATGAILESVRWLGLDWDEGPGEEAGRSKGPFGPYFQSQRLELYQEQASALVRLGYGYYCYCSPERLDEMRREQVARKQPPRYDRLCRHLSGAQRAQREAEGLPRVVRFTTPLEGETRFTDLIRGEITFANANLDDFVLMKSDGFPTYHLANVVDDRLMEITHVMRADEWLSSTPRHVLLYGALGWQPPHFAHLPMILGPDRSKLSKRHGATSLLEYGEQGFLPEAMLNFLALLGWSLDDRTEIIGREELVRHFGIERIGKTGAIFNSEKLEWMNGVYIRSLAPEELARRMAPFLDRDLPPEVPRPIPLDRLGPIVPLVQDRLKRLEQSAELTHFFFRERLAIDLDSLIQKGMDRQGTIRALERARSALEGLSSFDAGALEGVLRPLAEELGLKTGQLFGALRVAVTGEKAAPPLFETMAALGRQRCLARIAAAVTALQG